MKKTHLLYPKIAVFGAGNLGIAMAGYMALHGYNINLWNRTHSKIIQIIKNKKYIRI